MEQTFSEKVKSMTAKEIIMAMVRGLQNPYTKIKMSTFGYRDSDGVCFGCAATNTICEIQGGLEKGLVLSIDDIRSFYDPLIDKFELAIDFLRKGKVSWYNEIAEEKEFATIKYKEDAPYLPQLTNDYTLEDLLPYIQLAEQQ